MDQSLARDLQHVRDRLKEVLGPELTPLRGKRIFLTGGTGFFGKWLTQSFSELNTTQELGSTLTLLSRDPEKHRAQNPTGTDPAIQWVQGDLGSLDPMSFRGKSFDYVLHAATPADDTMIQREPERMFRIIVEGTSKILAIANLTGASRFLLTSSGAAQGRQPPELERMPEDFRSVEDPAKPLNAYARGKRNAETLVLSAKSDRLTPVVGRCFAFIGPHLPLDAHYAVGNFLGDALAGRPISVRNGTPVRSYLHAADLTVWLWTLLADPRANGVYQVGSGESVSIAELAARIGHVTGAKTPTPATGATVLPERYVPDTKRAEQELGLRTWINLDSALKRTWEWLRG